MIRIIASILVMLSISFWAGLFLLVDQVIRALTRNQ